MLKIKIGSRSGLLYRSHFKLHFSRGQIKPCSGERPLPRLRVELLSTWCSRLRPRCLEDVDGNVGIHMVQHAYLRLTERQGGSRGGLRGASAWAEANMEGIHSLRRNSDLELQNSSWAYQMPEQGTMSGSVSSLISAG